MSRAIRGEQNLVIRRSYDAGEQRKVTEIIRHLTASENSYKVYGYWLCRKWQCKHKPQQCSSADECERRELRLVHRSECEHEPLCRNSAKCKDKLIFKWQCENRCSSEWRTPYSQKSLKEYLNETPERQSELFIRSCKKHGENTENPILVSSFLLYTLENSNENLALEIIRHLEWKNHYRVFGNWKCSNCYKRWKSAYTWISLQKFIKKIPGKRLIRDDYYVQDCKKCGCSNNNYGVIMSYKTLVKSDENKLHKRNLCAKCQHGEICYEADNFFGYLDISTVP